MAGPLLIADVPWLLYRSFFALPKSITGAGGRPVNALLGTVNALLAAIDATHPRAVVACLGAEQAAYRVKSYPPYHAHRDPMPAELAEQWGQAPDLLRSLGWTVFDAGELEADDAMGAFARAERDGGGTALLLTGDRDLYQAVCEQVSVLELGRGGVFGLLGPEQVRERAGVAPRQIPDLIALRGDPSDGIPGAPGIGAKTAAQLLSEHGDLEELLRLAEDADGTLRPRVASALNDNADLLRTFKRLATLVPIDAPRPPDRKTDYAQGARAARNIGMNRLAERLIISRA